MDVIYKYLPIERIKYFEDELLRATQPGDLNDPFECLPVPPSVEDLVYVMNGVINERLKAFKKPKEKEAQRKVLVKTLQKQIDEIRNGVEPNFRTKFIFDGAANINNNVGLISFSQRWDSSLMWAHYTNSHRGLCIGFDVTDSFFQKYNNLDDGMRNFQPVNYQEERIKIPIERGEQIDPKVMLTKSKDWEYEQEYRLLIKLHEADKRTDAIPFPIFLLKIPHVLIKEVIIGAKFNNTNLEQIKKFCSEKFIDFYQAKISEAKFDMERFII